MVRKKPEHISTKMLCMGEALMSYWLMLGTFFDSGLMEPLGLIRQLRHAQPTPAFSIVIKSACVRNLCGKMTPASLFMEI